MAKSESNKKVTKKKKISRKKSSTQKKEKSLNMSINAEELASQQFIDEEIIIDADAGLVFSSEDDLFKHFKPSIDTLEKEYKSYYNTKQDIPSNDFTEFEDSLLEVLSNPDQIYEDEYRLPGVPLKQFVKKFENSEIGEYHYIALVYLVDETPTFVFLHFPTKDRKLLSNYTKGSVFFDIDSQDEMAFEEVDALTEGDELAVGLYNAMLKIRSESDIGTNKFQDYMEHRNESIEEADEIWRVPDFQGNTLVNFIKDYSEGDSELWYIAVAVEDNTTDSHYLLFSFPTNDRHLVDRYRHGESLHSEDFFEDEDSH